MSSDDPVTVLTEQECWELIGTHELGRLGFHLLEQVHVVPVNYAVDEDTLLFRTAEGSKLLAVVMHGDVVFEIDEYDDHSAWSVIVRGRAQLLDEHEEHRADNLPLRTWVDNPKYNVVEITPTEITGRHFRLHRPWLQMVPDDGG